VPVGVVGGAKNVQLDGMTCPDGDVSKSGFTRRLLACPEKAATISVAGMVNIVKLRKN